jgi:hypothetical protein
VYVLVSYRGVHQFSSLYFYPSKFPRLAQILVLVLVVDQSFPRFRRIPRWFSVFTRSAGIHGSVAPTPPRPRHPAPLYPFSFILHPFSPRWQTSC